MHWRQISVLILAALFFWFVSLPAYRFLAEHHLLFPSY
jgi:hypothetical protein